MVFHPTQKDITGLIPTLEINGIEIERVSEFKNLGVIIDENLSWNPIRIYYQTKCQNMPVY